MNIISLELDLKQIERLKTLTKDLERVKPPQYANYRVVGNGINIIIYNSNKVVFSGKKAAWFAQEFQKPIILPQAGSDETGNGSYFGPICVCAAYIDDITYEKIKHLNLTDSKAVNDDYINEIGQFLRDNVLHSLLVLDNKTYNEIIKSNNQNVIKAKLHNQVFLNLQKQIENMPELTVIDQFTPKQTYFNYLKNEKAIFTNLIFETKAESKYLAVAVASIIARFACNISLLQMSKHYNFTFLSGAGSDVDKNAQQFVNKYSKKALNDVAKLHFANTKKLK